MRVPNAVGRSRGNFDSTMTPMIDVVFLLLVFFVWTASFQAVEFLLPSNLATATGSEAFPPEDQPPPEIDQVVVQLDQTAGRTTWIINDSPAASLAAVQATLDQVASIRNDVPLIIDPTPAVPLGDVIDVYDVARLAGFDEIQFTATEP